MIQRGSETETCPVAALRAYLDAAPIVSGPLWRGFDKRDKPLPHALSSHSVWQILHDRARAAGVSNVSWPGLRFGFIEAAAKLPLFELQKRTLLSDRHALRRQLQRGRAQRRASAEKLADRAATADTDQHNVTKVPQKPLLFTWQTVSDVRSDLVRLFSSRRKSRSAKQQRGNGRSRRYTQADVAEIRSELTRLYGSTCASVRSTS